MGIGVALRRRCESGLCQAGLVSLDLGQEWTERAYRLVTDWAHIDETTVAGDNTHGGSRCAGTALARVLGMDFVRQRGVLAIGNVHREFRSGKLAVDPDEVVRQLIHGTRQLQRARHLDARVIESYMGMHRPAYEIGLAGGWTVARHFVTALRVCGTPLTLPGVRRLAYVNTSCCQFPELHKEADDTKRKKKLRRLCSSAHPMSEVVRILRPAIVLNASSVANVALRSAGVGGSVATVFFNQNSGSLEAPLTFPDGQVLQRGTHIRDWVEALRAHATTYGLLDDTAPLAE